MVVKVTRYDINYFSLLLLKLQFITPKFLYLLLFLPTLLFGQVITPTINFTTFHNLKNNYTKLLGLNDENALIIKTSEFEVDTLSGSYIAVLSNGDMYRYGVYSPNFKILIKKIKVNDNEKSKFLELIENVNTLDPAQLNLKNIVMKDGTKATIDIDHGFLYGLDVYQGKKSIHFESFGADYFITEKVDGYQMREKLLTIYKALDFSENIVANDIEHIKAQDTIYISFKEGAFEIKEKTGPDKYMYAVLLSRYGSLCFVKKHNIEPIAVSEKFVKDHTKQIINYDFFLKYIYDLNFLYYKKIYVIEEKNSAGKIIIYPIGQFFRL